MRALSLLRRSKRLVHRHPLHILSSSILFSMTALAIVDTLWSIYVNSFTQSPALTSVILAGLTAILFCFYLLFSAMIERHERTGYLLAATISGISFLLFPYLQHLWIMLVIGIISFAAIAIRNMSLGILVRDASTAKTISRNEGIKYMIANMGYLSAPLIVALLYNGTDFVLPFTLAGILVFLGGFTASVLHQPKHRTIIHPKPLDGFKEFWRSKQHTTIFLLKTGLSLYWTYIYVYLPLLIVYGGFPTYMIGIILFLVAAPLVGVESFTGRIAERLGYRQTFIFGFVMIGTCLTVAAFIPPSPLFFALVVGSAVGAALLEPTIEAYFFRITKRRDETKFLGTYFTAQPVGLVTGRLIGAGLVLLLGLHQLAIGFGIMLLAFTTVAARVHQAKQ